MIRLRKVWLWSLPKIHTLDTIGSLRTSFAVIDEDLIGVWNGEGTGMGFLLNYSFLEHFYTPAEKKTQIFQVL